MEVEAYNSHAEGKGSFKNPDINYIEEYNKMFGWRSHRNDQAASNSASLVGNALLLNSHWKVSVPMAILS